MRPPTEKELRDYYAAKAGELDEIALTYEHPNWYKRAFYGARFDAVFHSLDPRPGEHVLDAGSGPGYYTSRIAGAGARVVSLDIALGYLRRIRPGTGRSVQGDAQRLPFRDGVFDKVLATEVLEHTLRPERVVAEIARVLRRGGRAVITSPSSTSWMDRMYEIKARLRQFAFREHIQEFDREGFVKLLEPHVRLRRLQYANCLVPYPVDMLAMRLPARLGRKAFARLEASFASGRGGPAFGWTMVAEVERP